MSSNVRQRKRRRTSKKRAERERESVCQQPYPYLGRRNVEEVENIAAINDEPLILPLSRFCVF